MAETIPSIKDIMSVEGEIVKGRKWVKKAELATQGKKMITPHFEDNRFLSQLYPTHSTIEQFEFWFDCVVTERVHTHIARHKEINKYVQTSRPDTSRNKPRAPEGYRYLALVINAKRLIEICLDRLCLASHIDTVNFMRKIKAEAVKLEPCMQYVLFAKCVWNDLCTEINTDCGFCRSSKYNTERALHISKLTEIREKKKKAENIIR